MLTAQPGVQACSQTGVPTRRQVLDALLGLLAILLVAAAWTTHVVICATEGLWIFLALGLVVAPVALLHGVAAWPGL